jgi:hypothetical protein
MPLRKHRGFYLADKRFEISEYDSIKDIRRIFIYRKRFLISTGYD